MTHDEVRKHFNENYGNEIPRIDGFYYVAAPYGSHDPQVVKDRMKRYEEFDAWLASEGHYTFSPLDKHYKLKHRNLPSNYEFWKGYCHSMLKLSSGLIVITLLGWDTAPGVVDEIRQALLLNIPVYYI